MPPESENDRALRHTWSRGFVEAGEAGIVEDLEGVCGWVLTSAQNALHHGAWQWDTERELAAVALDLESLADYLRWKVSDREEGDRGEPERRLLRHAEAWEGRLRALVREMRATVGGEVDRRGDVQVTP